MEGSHEIKNGLLLRKDFYTLFDRGYITITLTDFAKIIVDILGL
ncbi:HNH endonuclease [Bacillus timonensis]